jgi:hypothetical protein
MRTWSWASRQVPTIRAVMPVAIRRTAGHTSMGDSVDKAIQTPHGPCRHPTRCMTNSTSPFTTTALREAHPYVQTRP